MTIERIGRETYRWFFPQGSTSGTGVKTSGKRRGAALKTAAAAGSAERERPAREANEHRRRRPWTDLSGRGEAPARARERLRGLRGRDVRRSSRETLEERQPDIALVDLELPPSGGVAAVAGLSPLHETRMIVWGFEAPGRRARRGDRGRQGLLAEGDLAGGAHPFAPRSRSAGRRRSRAGSPRS